MFPSLQSFAKKILASQHVLPEDYYHILKRCGLWWYKAPISLDCKHMLIRLPYFADGLDLNTALMIAAKENNYQLIKLFTEWGANINYGYICANTQPTREFCWELGANYRLDKKKVMHMFFKFIENKTSQYIILCHKLFNENPFPTYVIIREIKSSLYWRLRRLVEDEDLLRDVSDGDMLTLYCFMVALQNDLREAVSYFYQHFKHLNTWWLICALCFNKLFDLHYLYEQEKIRIDINEMMRIACTKDNNFLTMYYCFILGADINMAMLAAIQFFNMDNLFFCIDLGANAFEEAKALAEQWDYYLISHHLSLDIYHPDPSLFTLKEANPKKIYHLLNNYKSKSMSAYLDYHINDTTS
ncbi:MGF 360-10L [African swine fever virus]|uniref:MGF 360-10L n=1 Tax=African swine fever virus TaxID=10497 RepID=A0A895A0F8_ASF|nr:MGF 360-10L [African swine fever virus]QXP49814.1 MGF 360-10L [African swine fever virus]